MPNFQSQSPLLPELLELHAKWQQRKPAIVMDDESLSWREYVDRLNQVANGLIAAGLKKGDRVAVLMDNSIEALEVMFGIIKAGGVTVPLNLTVNVDGIAGMLKDAGVRAIFISSDYRGLANRALSSVDGLLQDGLFVVGAGHDHWIEYSGWRDQQFVTDPSVRVQADDLCNIIYSSGTTGLPKGIVHTHRPRLEWGIDLGRVLSAGPYCRVLITVGVYSNFSWGGIMMALAIGGTIYVHSGFSAKASLECIHNDCITHLLMVPIQYQRMWEVEGFSDYDLSSLRGLLSAGSPLFPELKEKMFDSVGDAVVEIYGLTEGFLTHIEGQEARNRLESVGVPYPGSDMKIIDDEGIEVKANVTGEIVGRSPYLMTEYFNRQEATREVMWTCPDGRVWLRTGDLGVIDEDGFLYIVGRKKDMIISGGQNIYPIDIESVLITHPEVNDCAVIGIPDEKWGETPVAIVVAEPDIELDTGAVKLWLNENVGKRQKVKSVKLRADLPRNPNGKVLKRELRDEYA